MYRKNSNVTHWENLLANYKEQLEIAVNIDDHQYKLYSCFIESKVNYLLFEHYFLKETEVLLIIRYVTTDDRNNSYNHAIQHEYIQYFYN